MENIKGINGLTVFLVVLVLILAGALAVFWFSDKGKPLPEEGAENAEQMSVVSAAETDAFYNIHAEYPQFKEINSDFNRKISEMISGKIEAFKKEVKDNWEARRATAPEGSPLPETPPEPFDFIAAWNPIQLNDKYLSFVINIYYFSGGAHGVTEVHAFNYDAGKNKEITITDFLNSSTDSLAKLAQVASQQVTAQLQAGGINIDDSIKQMIADGTQPTPENYRNFNFSYISLIIYFEQYQVAPGYIGPVTINIYKDTLAQSGIASNYLQ